ncbi:MAG: hypothetical protein H0X24_00960 [Ktedonobacterales bacterium]|nr:hypothetical protein [Ktedonobacterales bacterium]
MSEFPQELQRLPLPPMPAVFERALGYGRNARYLVLYWDPCGDEVTWDDGEMLTQGNWQSFLVFVNHAAIAPVLDGYDLGGSDAPARDGLVLDRQTRHVYAGPLPSARRFVAAQHGPALTFEEWAALEGITVAEAHARQDAAVAAWLTTFSDSQADVTTQGADLAERLRIAAANQSLLQAALDALPRHPLPAAQAHLTLRRVTCGVCHQQIGTIPQDRHMVAARMVRHLVDVHRITADQWEIATWEPCHAGGQQLMQDSRMLVLVEPPHVWISGSEESAATLASHLHLALVSICRQHYAGLFDELALGVWCGISPSALLQRVRQVTDTTRSLTQGMAEATLSYLTDQFRQWQATQKAEGELHD